MTDYYPLIARAVANLPQNTEAARRALYQRARSALDTQLRGRSEAEVVQERRSLDEAIRRVEIESGVAKHGRVGRKRTALIAGSLLATALVVVVGLFAVAGNRWRSILPLPKSLASGSASDEMVPMRSNVVCQLQGLHYISSVGPGGALTNTGGSVNQLLCAYSGAPSRDIPLASDKIENGIMKTRDFGNVRVDFANSISSNAFSMYMRSADQDKLAAFLQTQEAAEEYQLVEPADLSILLEMGARSMTQAADCSGAIEGGHVDALFVAGRSIALQSTDAPYDAKAKKAWIATKDYGNIGISGGYAGNHPPSGLCWWLTPSQQKSFKALAGSK